MKALKKKISKKDIPLFNRGVISFQDGGAIIDPMGQWNHPYQETIVPTQDGRITMKGVSYPVQGIDLETGESQFMMPNKEYKFRGKNIYEIPIFQDGGRLVNKSEIPNYINQGYKPIGNNQYVKNGAKLGQLQAAQKSTQIGGTEYNNWIKSEIEKGRPISELVKMGYGTEEGIRLLAQNIKPISDTIRYVDPNIQSIKTNANDLKYKDFDYNNGFVKGMERGDTLFFKSSVPEEKRQWAKVVWENMNPGKKAVGTFTRENFSYGTIPIEKKKKGGFYLPKAQGGINNFFPSQLQTKDEILPPDGKNPYLENTVIKPKFDTGAISLEQVKQNVDTNYQIQEEFDRSTQSLIDKGYLFNNEADSFRPKPLANPALFTFGKAALSALGKRQKDKRDQESIQDRLNDPFQILPDVTTNNEFLNKGNRIFEEGGEYEEDDFSFLFNDEEPEMEEEQELDNFTISEPEEEEENEEENEEEDWGFEDEDEKEEENNITTSSTTQSQVNNFTSVVPPINNSKDGSFAGIFRNEGAKTGQPTNLKSSAIGRGQMIEGTRKAMYKKLGIKDINWAEKEFRTNPDFEMQVLNAYREELNSRIPPNIQGKQREYMIAKGWYTGDPFYPDNKVPGRSAGNRLTAGEYARRAIK